MLAMSQREELEKIAVLGLDAAGKTSIIRVLMQEFKSLDYLKPTDKPILKPTQKVERSIFDFLGRKLVFWDFGGQEKYREKYLSTPDRFFENIECIFYVVDIQDPKKLSENVDYFQQIFATVQIHSPDAKYVLIFHKYDPGEEDTINELNIKTQFLQRVDEFIRPIISKSMKEHEDSALKMFQTSIYNPTSILTAFSTPFLGVNDITETLSGILNTFITENKLLFATLFTNNYFELASAMSNKLSDENKGNIIQQLMISVSLFPGILADILMLDNEIPFKSSVLGFELSAGSIEIPFYLAIGYIRNINEPLGRHETLLVNQNELLKKILKNSNIFMLLNKKS
jgi:Ras-related GTP-binding protein A/B